MKFKILHLCYTIVAIIGLATLTSNSSGKVGVSATGCGGSGCHTSSASTTILISFDGNSNLTTYTPGKKYSILVTVSNSSFSGNANAKAGFDLSFSKGNINANPTNTMVMGQELHHTAPKTLSSGSTTYSFDWTAPGAGQGNINIDISANIVNGDGGTSGDAWAKLSKSLTEEVSTTSKKPSIASITSTSITNTGVTINAQINANNLTTAAEVQYGKTTAYGSVKAMTPSSITGTSNTTASAVITGLEPNTTYNYRIKASNTTGDSLSTNSTFKTTSAGAAILSTDQEVISIFPNPSTNYVIIKGQNLGAEKEITLVDMSGKKIVLPTLRNGFDEVKLNTSSLSKGMYYLRLDSKSYPLVIER